MHTASLIPVFFALLSSYTALAVPLPSGCKCDETPLSPRSLNYIREVAKARYLTNEECAFLCNPSSQTQQSMVSASSGTSPSAPVNSPPLYDPATPRPLPLFDGPPSIKSGSEADSAPPVPVSAYHASTKSTMAPPAQGTLHSCMLRVTGSLVLLLIMAICVVEVGDMAWVAVRRRLRGRRYSASGRLRLEDEIDEKGGLRNDGSQGLRDMGWI
ncbi:hypothetical protein MMC30_005123 [Trapelia coarctata]|nr:hypothetical protein [Trapelia coarctata]